MAVVSEVAAGRVATVSTDSPLVQELTEQALERGVNLAQLVAKAYMAVEEASQVKSHAKVDTLEALEKKLKTVTTFLTNLESQLANPDAKQISMADHSSSVEEMHKILDHKLLEKTSWTRAEAEAIRTALTRHSQVILQEVQHASSDVNRAIEEGTELLQIARKLLDMLDRLHQTFTSNQRKQ